MKLLGKAALVTGGGTGIGYAIALEFLKEGASVLITGRRREALQEALKAIKTEREQKKLHWPGCLDACPGDVAVPEDAEKMVSSCVAEFGKLDILVCNAGVYTMGTVPDTGVEEYDRVTDINLKGTFLMCKYGVPAIIEAGGGSVLTISSSLGVKGAANTGVYGAAKAAVIHLTKVMALDHAKNKVRFNCIAPAVVETPIHEAPSRSSPEEMQKYYQQMAAWHPLGRVGKPEEIAKAAVYLSSEDASWVTGAVFCMDGGVSVK